MDIITIKIYLKIFQVLICGKFFEYYFTFIRQIFLLCPVNLPLNILIFFFFLNEKAEQNEMNKLNSLLFLFTVRLFFNFFS